MRYAVLSDVHANLEALRAVLADAAGLADGLLCLGDVVGYGADPAPCLELLAERVQAMAVGNHEHAVAGLLDLGWFNHHARVAAEWTRDQLDRDQRAYLVALPLVTVVEDATLVHASPAEPQEWDYLVTAADGFAVFSAFQTRLCFVGHSHVPGVWSLASAGPYRATEIGELTLEPGRRYLVNVGSVGQPRDRDPRAAYVLWDLDEGRISLRRVPYDIETARAKILAAGLPRFLADRLASGS